MNIPVVGGRPPNAAQENMIAASAEHWYKIGNEVPVQALGRVEDAAKQLVSLNGALQGLYFAVFAFSDLKARVSGDVALLFLLPVGCWLASLSFATLVFVPRARPNTDLDNLDPKAWLTFRDTYFDVVNRKLAWLHWAHAFLLVSFVAVLALLIALVFLPAIPASTPTRVIILTPTPLSVPTRPS